jgi:hypothetical protein
MFFNSENGAEVTVTRIDTVPNIGPSGPDDIFDSQYWVVNRFGSGVFNADLTFTVNEGLTSEDEITPSKIKLYSRGSTADTSWAFLTSASSVNAAGNTATFTGITSFSQFIVVRDKRIKLDLTAFLEGPYNGIDMNTDIYGELPLTQPYNITPWNYTGTESVASIPNNVVDWVLIELRDTTDASLATGETVIARQAAFLLNDGSVVDTAGNEACSVAATVTNNLYVVIWHRNHLGIMSANPVIKSGGVYTYDFTTSAEQAFGDNQADLGSGVYGMYAADMNANGVVDETDLNLWKQIAGQKGYLTEDANLDSQVDNKDKNDFWQQNIWEASNVPQ